MGFTMINGKRLVTGVAVVLAVPLVIWLLGSRNPYTPAGSVGYLTQGAIFGKARFYGLQTGPASAGRTWLLGVQNVSVTPWTYDENFSIKNGTSVITKDNLPVGFSVHIVWRVDRTKVKDFIEKYSTLSPTSDEPVEEVAYNNYLKEPLRTDARQEVQKLNGLDVKDNIPQIGKDLFNDVEQIVKGTPFLVESIVVGNIQYPQDVIDAISEKVATTQKLETEDIKINVAKKQARQRVVDAEGIAESMRIINKRLTAQYLQHEAIQAQAKMIGSPNHTVVYIPTGKMGVPLTGTFPLNGQ